MPWTIEYDEAAVRDLKKLDHQAQREILDFMEKRIGRAEDLRSFGKQLRHSKFGLWRYRLRDYRIICQLQQSNSSSSSSPSATAASSTTAKLQAAFPHRAKTLPASITQLDMHLQIGVYSCKFPDANEPTPVKQATMSKAIEYFRRPS